LQSEAQHIDLLVSEITSYSFNHIRLLFAYQLFQPRVTLPEKQARILAS
jgi:hypothetical protein